MKRVSLIICLLSLLATAPAWATVSLSVSPTSPTTSDAVTITVTESGTFNSSCLPIQLNYGFGGSGIIEITPFFDPNEFCNNVLTDNQYTLSVNVGKLGAGSYTVRLFSATGGQVEKSFSVTGLTSSVSISVSPTSPTTSDAVTITVTESGTFNSSCLPIQLNYGFGGSGIIEITPFFDPNEFCNNVLTDNQYTLSVNVGKLGAGSYTVRLFSATGGQVEKSFSVTGLTSSVSISVSPTSPTTSDAVTITVTESGTFNSSCLPIQLNYGFGGSGIIEITPFFDPNEFCNNVLTDNQYTLSVNVGKLGAGSYTVRLFSATGGQVEKSFSVKQLNANLAGCATFDFFTGLLRIPDFELAGTSYILDFRWVGLNPIVYELVGIFFGEPSPQSATYDFSTAVIYVPCLSLAGGSYWTEWQVFDAGGGVTRMQLINFGENL